jgi:glycerophosphoryl diester phosphodiesterase
VTDTTKRFTPQMRALDWLVARPIAHRGLHAKSQGVIENSVSAFDAAIKKNYAIECDLQITGDGNAVVFHDETLDRLSDATGMVRARSTRELQAITLSNSNDRIQSFDEMLEQVNGQVPLVIELKSHWDGDVALAATALKILERYAGPYAIMSFDPDLVAAVAELSPRTVRGITADRAVDSYYSALPLARRIEMRTMSHLARTKPHFVSYYFRDLPFAPIQTIRAAGHPIITWTIRSKEQERVARRYSDQVTFEGYDA